jgi:hypothetical protein
LLALGLLCAALYGPALLDRERALSHITGDTSQFFLAMRGFAVSEIRDGRLPLWNPYLMSGTPFVGNFQSALFYPPNALYLALPVADAADADYTLHTFLAGAFMFLWARRRAVSRRGAVLAGAIAMFGSPFFLRMLGGQLTMVDAMAWAPLLFLSIEMIFDAARDRAPLVGPVLLGAGATAMQMLAGHPQTVFITGVTAGLYCAVRFFGASNRVRAAAALAGFAAWGPLLSAVQLLPGLQTMTESLRMGGVGSDFATTFSFPPENLITLLAPAFFGDRVKYPYWGQWALWDAVLFFGVTGAALAAYGARYAPARQRAYAPFLAILILFLAMGRYSPVYGVFAAIPVFDVLRGVSKFLFAGTLFAALLAGIGHDLLAANAPAARPRRAALALVALIPALGLGMLAVWLAMFTDGGEAWRGLMFRQMADGYVSALWFDPPANFFSHAAIQAIASLGIASLTLALLAGLFWRAGRGPAAAHAVLALGLFELAAFAYVFRDTFAVRDLRPPALEKFYVEHADSDRVVQLGGPGIPYARNLPMDKRHPAVWGYEPVMLHRYATFLALGVSGKLTRLSELLEYARFGSDIVELGLDSGRLDFHLDPATHRAGLPREFDLLRCRYVIVPEGLPKSPAGIYENPGALPRFLLLHNYVVHETLRDIFETMSEPSFDPRRTVVLEQTPDPAPSPADASATGEVVVEDESSDHVTLRVAANTPTILLVTDPYSTGWGIRALPDSAQRNYQILPGDYALRAVPLTAGAHHFRMEYRPAAFGWGVILSLGASILYAGAVVYWAAMSLGAYAAKKSA